MDRAELNWAKKQKYRDPAVVLRELREIELSIPSEGISDEVRHLRTNELKKIREFRQAALFCHGMSVLQGEKIRFLPAESSDYDFVTAWLDEEFLHIAPVQLKELPPEHLNKNLTLQDLVDKLLKYTVSPELTVVIFINRNGVFEPSKLSIPNLNLASLWVVSCISEDQSKWRLSGNFLETPSHIDFEYPT